MAIAKVLADFYLAVRYQIAIHIYASKKFWWFGGLPQQPPKFPAKFSGYTVVIFDTPWFKCDGFQLHSWACWIGNQPKIMKMKFEMLSY